MRDDESSFLVFARRNPKSNRGRKNRERAERMIREGLMTDAGMAMITLARKTGRWTALEEIQNAVAPEPSWLVSSLPAKFRRGAATIISVRVNRIFCE